jgi:hypothetical protein
MKILPQVLTQNGFCVRFVSPDVQNMSGSLEQIGAHWNISTNSVAETYEVFSADFKVSGL